MHRYRTKLNLSLLTSWMKRLSLVLFWVWSIVQLLCDCDLVKSVWGEEMFILVSFSRFRYFVIHQIYRGIFVPTTSVLEVTLVRSAAKHLVLHRAWNNIHIYTHRSNRSSVRCAWKLIHSSRIYVGISECMLIVESRSSVLNVDKILVQWHLYRNISGFVTPRQVYKFHHQFKRIHLLEDNIKAKPWQRHQIISPTRYSEHRHTIWDLDFHHTESLSCFLEVQLNHRISRCSSTRTSIAWFPRHTVADLSCRCYHSSTSAMMSRTHQAGVQSLAMRQTLLKIWKTQWMILK